MKRYLYSMLFFLSFNSAIISTDQNSPKKVSFYNAYFIIKEFSNFCITYRYYMDQEKIEKAKIACNQCDYIVGYRNLCCYYIFEIESKKLQNTLNQMENTSTDELSSLLLNSYEELNIPCDQCQQYHGWHIETSGKIIQHEKETVQVEHAKQKIYTAYCIFKEFCKMHINEYFINHKKIKDASIYCTQCNRSTDSQWLWTSLIFECNETGIIQLKDYIYNKPSEELQVFILQKYQEIKLYCPYCGDYHGYYIPETAPSTQD